MLSKEQKLQILNNARLWLNTEWGHNQQSIGGQVDCIRLVQEAYKGIIDISNIPKNYSNQPTNSFNILTYLKENFNDKNFNGDFSIIDDCDILVFKYTGLPHHVGLASTGLANERYIIHSSVNDGKVVEYILAGKLKNKLIGVFCV